MSRETEAADTATEAAAQAQPATADPSQPAATPSIEDRDSLVFLAKLAEKTDRFGEMSQAMRKVAMCPQLLSVDERNLLSVAFKNVIGPARASWRIVSTHEQKDDTRQELHAEIIRQMRVKIESELESTCREILQLLEEHLIPRHTDHESMVFYCKMKGDYYRYLAEFMTDEARESAAKSAHDAYEAASKIATESLQATHPIRLGLALNFSVFFFEIFNLPQRACRLAKTAFDDAITELDSLSQESYRDSTAIMQLLRDNLSLWTADEEKGLELGTDSADSSSDSE